MIRNAVILILSLVLHSGGTKDDEGNGKEDEGLIGKSIKSIPETEPWN